MAIDLEKLSAKELRTLISKANQRKKQLDKRKPAAGVRRQIVAIARKAGYSVAELFGGAAQAAETAPKAKRAARKAGKSGTKVAPKYRHPDNHAQSWAGRGQKPRWLTAELANGKKLEDFLIA